MDYKNLPLEKKQKLNKGILAVIKFFLYPALFQLWFYLTLTLIFKVPYINYYQSFILLLGINLINTIKYANK
jgi:hypothetical protein